MSYEATRSAKKGAWSAADSVVGSAVGSVLVYASREFLKHPMDASEAIATVTICGAVGSYMIAHARNWAKHRGR